MQNLVLNLQRRPDRWRKFQEQNNHLSNYTRKECIDGPQQVRDGGDLAVLCGKKFSYYFPASIGNHATHAQCWELAANTEENTTIFEDDAVIHQEFNRHSRAIISEAPDEWDVIYWGWTFACRLAYELYHGGPNYLCTPSAHETPRKINDFLAHEPQTRLHRVWGIWNSFAYTVSPKGARSLLRLCWPISDENGVLPMTRELFAIYGVDAKMCATASAMNSFVCIDPLVLHPHDPQDTDMLLPGHEMREISDTRPTVPAAPTHTPNAARNEEYRPKPTMLNIGCGTTPRPAWAKHYAETRCDPDEKVIVDDDYDWADLSYEESTFDLVYASHVYEHLAPEDAATALAETWRVLKPGGVLYMLVPDSEAALDHAQKNGWDAPLYQSQAGPITSHDVIFGLRSAIQAGRDRMRHEQFILPAEVTRQLTSAGFIDVDWRTLEQTREHRFTAAKPRAVAHPDNPSGDRSKGEQTVSTRPPFDA